MHIILFENLAQRLSEVILGKILTQKKPLLKSSARLLHIVWEWDLKLSSLPLSPLLPYFAVTCLMIRMNTTFLLFCRDYYPESFRHRQHINIKGQKTLQRFYSLQMD